ncbi:hypothetical protein LXL04_010181 [Taraxacum kok-saghyz]
MKVLKFSSLFRRLIFTTLHRVSGISGRPWKEGIKRWISIFRKLGDGFVEKTRTLCIGVINRIQSTSHNQKTHKALESNPAAAYTPLLHLCSLLGKSCIRRSASPAPAICFSITGDLLLHYRRSASPSTTTLLHIHRRALQLPFSIGSASTVLAGGSARRRPASFRAHSSAPLFLPTHTTTTSAQQRTSPVDKWKCQGQMDKSNHSKPTRVVGRSMDNFDSIVRVLIQFFMFCYFDSFFSKAGDLSCISYF